MSRLQITGVLDEDTPIVVLMEIAGSHGIAVNQRLLRRLDGRRVVVKCLNGMKPMNLTPTEPARLARFINHRVDWNLPALIRSFNFIKQFMTPSKLTSEFPWSEIMALEVGPQVPKRPRRLNACMLYRLCREIADIKPQLEASLEGMKLLIELSVLPPEALRKIVHPRGKIESAKNMLKLIAQMPEARLKSRLKISRADLMTVNKTVINPKNRAEAIYLAFNLGVDISRLKSPIAEYYRLKSNTDKYLRMKDRKCQCPELESLNINMCYNPIIPFDWYPFESVKNFIQLAGYEYHLVTNPEEIIQLAYLTDNFYFGKAPLIANIETPINLDEVSELNAVDVVSYGIPGKPMTVISITELEMLFKNNGNFSKPGGGYYSETVIAKLSIIARSLQGVIQEIREFQRIDDSSVSELSSWYNREAAVLCLTELLHLAMYMRGWDGKSAYPIGSAPVEPGGYDSLMINASRYLLAFIEKMNTDLTWGMVGSLPMRLYKSGKYLKTQDSETIGQRLEKVQQGEGVQACIRISSNWLASSAYFYQRCLGKSVDLDIANMRHIA